MLEIVYIGVGANLNNPRQQVEKAIVSLSQLAKSSLVAQSSLYLSPPMGPQDQSHFVNAVVKLETQLSPIELLDHLQSVETSQGRVRNSERWGPRTLDLDLLLYGRHIIEESRLKVPHYGMNQRSFVLIPLAEIDPALILPDNSLLTDHIKQLVTQTGNQGIQKL